jgi:GT2 family glycosyltransferase
MKRDVSQMREPLIPLDRDAVIGVVTVTFNSGSVIRGFMNSILKQSHAKFVLYVVDNASWDSTLECLAEYDDPRIVIVRNQTNVGAAEGNNIGIRAALKDGCASVVLINNDTVLDDDLFFQLIVGMRQHDADMVVPKILYFDEPNKIWSAGGYFSWLRGAARHFGSDRNDEGQFDRSRFVDYSPTTCMLIRKEVFTRIGFLDARYFAYFEDTDFCYRARLAGVRLVYFSSARLLHRVSSLTGRDSDFTIRYSIRNHVYYVLKNFPSWQRLFYLPALQFHLVAKFILLRRKLSTFWLAEKAFSEGISIFYSQLDRGETPLSDTINIKPLDSKL